MRTDLAALGDPVISFLKHQKMDARQAAACVRALRLIGTERAKEALEAYLEDRRKLVVDELAQAVNPLRVAYWLDLVAGGTSLPESIARQIVGVEPLAGRTNLQTLLLDQMQVADLGPLAGLTNLETLSPNETQVADLGPLAGLRNCRSCRWKTQAADRAAGRADEAAEAVAGRDAGGGSRATGRADEPAELVAVRDAGGGFWPAGRADGPADAVAGWDAGGGSRADGGLKT